MDGLACAITAILNRTYSGRYLLVRDYTVRVPYLTGLLLLLLLLGLILIIVTWLWEPDKLIIIIISNQSTREGRTY